jgi:hypothetical protein
LKRPKSELEPALSALADIVRHWDEPHHERRSNAVIDNDIFTLAGGLVEVVTDLLKNDQWKQRIDPKWLNFDRCTALFEEEEVRSLRKEGGLEALLYSGPCSWLL